MKKVSLIILSVLGLLVIGTSCKKTKSYADYLNDEAKAIEKFIAQNKISILKTFPKDSVFKDNEYYRDPATGVYFNIISLGTSKKTATIGEDVYVRFSGLRYFDSDRPDMEYSNLNTTTSPDPDVFRYSGEVTMANSSKYSGTTPAWVVPLKYVGQDGKVKMIVPFNMGSSSDKSRFTPSFYQGVTYRFQSQS